MSVSKINSVGYKNNEENNTGQYDNEKLSGHKWDGQGSSRLKGCEIISHTKTREEDPPHSSQHDI